MAPRAPWMRYWKYMETSPDEKNLFILYKYGSSAPARVKNWVDVASNNQWHPCNWKIQDD